MDYSKYTIQQLKELCKAQNITGISKKNKTQLITSLNTLNKSPEEKTPKYEIPDKIIKNKNEDNYTKELLKEQYELHKSYVNGRIKTTKNIGVNIRLPSIPEDISENIIKQIIHNRLNDKTSIWNCKNGDLFSQKEGKQECKCFTSDGPISFTPTSNWDIIYFLDAKNWLEDKFILYRVLLTKNSIEWKNINISKTQTFEDQSKQGRRPRINWNNLYPQIKNYCTKIYDGNFDEIFIPQ